MLNYSEVINALDSEINALKGKSLDPIEYQSQPGMDSYTPGVYHVINTKICDLYPLEHVAYYLLRADGTGVWYDGNLNVQVDCNWPKGGLEYLAGWHFEPICKIMKIV